MLREAEYGLSKSCASEHQGEGKLDIKSVGFYFPKLLFVPFEASRCFLLSCNALRELDRGLKTCKVKPRAHSIQSRFFSHVRDSKLNLDYFWQHWGCL